MDMPKPTAAHEKLAKLIGRWSGPETMPPGPWAPGGGTALGRVENRAALDGFVVIQDYAQERDGEVVFRGHGVFGWNPGAGHYTLHWFDSMGMGVNEYRGDFAGDVLSLISDSPMGKSRAVFDLGAAGRYVFRMDVSQDGQAWTTFMEGSYTRVG